MNGIRINIRLLHLVGVGVFFSCGAFSQVPEKVKSVDRVVVSGFEPFGDRMENASWILAQEIKKSIPTVITKQVPVVWGAPLNTIRDTKPLPDVWIAFGEGAREFQVEVFAHNERGHYGDNKGQQPAVTDIVPGAPATLTNDIRADVLAKALSSEGFPTHVSRDAGAYLCEEMLYSLLHTQEKSAGTLKVVLFVHVPVLGAEISTVTDGTAGQVLKRKIDGAFLSMFGKQLFVELEKLKLLKK